MSVSIKTIVLFLVRRENKKTLQLHRTPNRPGLWFCLRAFQAGRILCSWTLFALRGQCMYED